MPTFDIEEALANEGYTAICGVDEAGRGPLSGPVVAAACILPLGVVIKGLDDSKKLTPKKREALFEEITEVALSYSIASASVKEIDQMNILNATMLAMRRAIEGLSQKADFALIDGNTARDFSLPCQTVIKGDSLSYSIAAASILAKVTRDRLCLEDDKAYPLYEFAKHKGYGTARHMALIREHGPCPIHRRSFLGFLSQPPKK
ncbi:MAG: ribonuclease HII [Clostridia bacterium]|nr:ribonuclease HII [Clostridia bacterium]